MEIFQFTKSYTFLAPKGRRERFFFKLIERCYNKEAFVFYGKGDENIVEGRLSMDGDTNYFTLLSTGEFKRLQL